MGSQLGQAADRPTEEKHQRRHSAGAGRFGSGRIGGRRECLLSLQSLCFRDDIDDKDEVRRLYESFRYRRYPKVVHRPNAASHGLATGRPAPEAPGTSYPVAFTVDLCSRPFSHRDA